MAAPLVAKLHAALAPTRSATPTSAGDLAALFAELDAFVANRMAELKVPGVAIGVIAGDQEHAMGFGVTNVDHPLPVDTDTLFQIGSTTKTFTGTALMRLVEQGRLDLEAPVQSSLPTSASPTARFRQHVRLRHLVTHTAGWYDNFPQETGDGDDALARAVAGMAELPQYTARQVLQLQQRGAQPGRASDRGHRQTTKPLSPSCPAATRARAPPSS